jgi:hypothetical protein
MWPVESQTTGNILDNFQKFPYSICKFSINALVKNTLQNSGIFLSGGGGGEGTKQVPPAKTETRNQP